MARRTVHVHLNRRCNLACAHCYSRSGPRERAALDPGRLLALLAEVAGQGYEVVSFSGGEPFLYPAFGAVLAEARALGLGTSVVTNGTVLTGPRRALLDLIDVLAVSMDGPAPVHNAIRRSPTAFSRMEAGLATMRADGVAFGLAHTVHPASLGLLDAVADYARAAGAAVLQLHPLGAVGAASERPELAIDAETHARIWLAGLALRLKHGDALPVQVDLFNRELLRASPRLVVPPAPMPGARLSDLINPLVVSAEGMLTPVLLEAGPRHVIGTLAAPLAPQAAAWIETGLPAWRQLCAGLLDAILADPDGWPYLNWYEQLEWAAAASDPPRRAAA